MDIPKIPPNKIYGELSEHVRLLEHALSGQGQLLTEARRAHALLASTFNAISDAIIVTDAAGRITQANLAVLHLFNRVPEEIIGATCHSMLDKDQGCPHPQLTRDKTGDQNVIESELLNRAQDRALNLRVSRISDLGSGESGFMHIIRDVTRERIIERHLMQAERMSLAGQLVSAVAHEVATPLSVVANIAEILRLDAEQGSHLDAELGKIVTQARRVAEMMRGVLNFVRQAPAQYKAVDLSQLVYETVELMRYELRKADIEAQIEVAPGTPPVWGDSNQLQQVLLNLLTNAMQALEGGGRVIIHIGEGEGWRGEPNAIALVVEDTGPGIAPEVQSKIFDFFFTTRLGKGGTGLGLAITKQIIEGHHGRITAENMRGGGARFVVTLPAALPSRQPYERDGADQKI